jgi:Cd2+/Zn2+-exporting ATPase
MSRFMEDKNDDYSQSGVRGMQPILLWEGVHEGETKMEWETQDRPKWFREWRRHGEMVAAALCGVLLLAAWVLEQGGVRSAAWVYLTAYIIGGFAKAREGILTLIRERELDVNLLMFLAAGGAAAIGHWAEGGMLVFIFSLSGALETYTMARSERDLSSLLTMKPETARVVDEAGNERFVSAAELRKGDRVLVKPGERIPADGRVIKGHSSAYQAAITGEPLPVEKAPGDEVFAGTMNGDGALVLEVARAGEDSLFARIVKLIEEAKSRVPRSQHRVERLERLYARAILIATLLIMVLPGMIGEWTWSESVYRAMVFLVVASPCALVASIMPALLSAMSNGARKGLLFKSGIHLESLAEVKVAAFDKTGTLTEGKPRVTDVVAFGGWKEERLLQAVASIERMSEHLLAEAVVEEARRRGLMLDRPERMTAYPGRGVSAEYAGMVWRIGKPKWFEQMTEHPEIWETVTRLESEGKTVILAEADGRIAGCLALMDRLRPEAARIVRELQSLGIRVAMLTGDQKETALSIAREAGIELVYSDLLPEDKVRIVEELSRTHGRVAMIGDGVNDSPALAAASVGLAMGGAGTDVALETADLVLMNDDLSRIPYAVRLGQRLKSVIRQNIVFALSVIVVLVAANFAQWMNLPVGVVGHEGSTILVILNGLRLLR